MQRRRHFCPAGKPFKAEVVEKQDLHWRESKPFFPVGVKCMVNKNKVRILGKGSWRREERGRRQQWSENIPNDGCAC